MGNRSLLNSVLAGGLISKDLLNDLKGLRRRRRRGGQAHLFNVVDEYGQDEEVPLFDVIVEFNETLKEGIERARRTFLAQFQHLPEGVLAKCYLEFSYPPEFAPLPFKFETNPADQIYIRNSLGTKKYVFACLTAATLQAIAEANDAYRGEESPEAAKSKDPKLPSKGPIYRIWKDHPLDSQVFQSSCTIKADAARLTFSTYGEGVTWAVADSGIMALHPHFVTHSTLALNGGMKHRDFTVPDSTDEDDLQKRALTDSYGHGTHIAGIIAGETLCPPDPDASVSEICIVGLTVDDEAMKDDPEGSGGDGIIPTKDVETVRKVSVAGIAPKAKLLSLKVLNASGGGRSSFVIAAIAYIRRLNTNSEENRVLGVNMSLGYVFDLDWYGAGQSPLCREVNSLVQAGVCVVAAAGNNGGDTIAVRRTASTVGYVCSISDPGNAERAITVGSTHREKPHKFGISFFSSKGPTLDGRMKPDLVAPGERIISCDAKRQPAAGPSIARFCEQSGTSQATAHVSGAAAALMSWRSEFRNDPDAVKALFMSSATDLRRLPAFQGSGMIDVMRAFLQV